MGDLRSKNPHAVDLRGTLPKSVRRDKTFNQPRSRSVCPRKKSSVSKFSPCLFQKAASHPLVPASYLPTQKREKIPFTTSSVTVLPSTEPSADKASSRSVPATSSVIPTAREESASSM